MSKEKQIEEIGVVLSDALHENNIAFANYMRDSQNHPAPMGDVGAMADALYNAGYRKQSEGEWIYHECVSSYDGAISGYSCSRCASFVNEDVFDTDEFHKMYCGNCGAKMKGGA